MLTRQRIARLAKKDENARRALGRGGAGARRGLLGIVTMKHFVPSRDSPRGATDLTIAGHAGARGRCEGGGRASGADGTAKSKSV